MNSRSRLTSLPRILAVAILLSLLIAAATSLAPNAHAQVGVVGSADFRNAPQLPSGDYVDRIVSGDSAWYAVMYTNGTPYEFQVDFQGTDPGRGFDLNVSFVAPTLTTVDGPGAIVNGSGVNYPAGHTNVWFLKVSLDTTEQIGIEYPITISVDGVRAESLEDCGDVPGCVLDEEFAALNVALAEATAELEQAESAETLARVRAEIENLRGFEESADTLAPAAETRLARAEATMAELCAPEIRCEEFPDPPPKTPLFAWILGLAVLGFGGYRAVKNLTADPAVETSEANAPSSLDRAQADKESARARAKSK